MADQTHPGQAAWEEASVRVQVFRFEDEAVARGVRHRTWVRSQDSDEDVTDVYPEGGQWCVAIVR
jgi:hypothetical protein